MTVVVFVFSSVVPCSPAQRPCDGFRAPCSLRPPLVSLDDANNTTQSLTATESTATTLCVALFVAGRRTERVSDSALIHVEIEGV